MEGISGGRSGGNKLRDAQLRLFTHYAKLYESGEITQDDMLQFWNQLEVLHTLDPDMMIGTKTVREWNNLLFKRRVQ